MRCICCNNNKINSFENLNYTNFGSMNYPEEMKDAKIKYCKLCTFSFCYPFVKRDRLNLYYEKYYNGKSIKSDSHQDNIFIRNIFFDQRSISQISLISQFENLNNKTVLDIGSGSAIFYLQLNRIGFKNIEKYILEPQLKNKNWYDQNSIKIIENDIYDLENKYENFFDLIVLSHSLEHFNSEDAELIIKSIYKLLKKNGKIFIEVPNADLKLYPKANENMQPHLSFFTKKSLSALLENNSFDILFAGLFGASQKTKKTQDFEDNFHLNKDKMLIHSKSDINSNKIYKKRKYLNLILHIISLILSKKLVIFLKDYYYLFLKRKTLNMNEREFRLNNIDGEFLRIIGEKK